MTTKLFKLDCFGLTDRGLVREANEDNFLIAGVSRAVEVRSSSLAPDVLKAEWRPSGQEATLLAVADGVGGRPGGAVASGSAVTALLQYLRNAAGCYQALDAAREDELLVKLEATVRSLHDRLHAESPDGHPPATTLTLGLVVWPRVYLVHVGDSRAYVRRRGRLQMLTRDQTVGEYMVNVGAWTEAQARKSARGSALASAVGASDLTPSVGLIDLEPGDILLLCSDGLTRHVNDDRLAEVLGAAADAESATRELVRLALADGGTDNVTVIVARA